LAEFVDSIERRIISRAALAWVTTSRKPRLVPFGQLDRFHNAWYVPFGKMDMTQLGPTAGLLIESSGNLPNINRPSGSDAEYAVGQDADDPTILVFAAKPH
jgi:hypothetical protein